MYNNDCKVESKACEDRQECMIEIIQGITDTLDSLECNLDRVYSIIYGPRPAEITNTKDGPTCMLDEATRVRRKVSELNQEAYEILKGLQG